MINYGPIRYSLRERILGRLGWHYMVTLHANGGWSKSRASWMEHRESR